MADEKIYVGSGKVKEFDNGGNLMKISICIDDIMDMPACEHIYKSKAGKRYIRLDVGEKRKPDEWGKTHYVSVDTYKSEKKQDDMPF